MSLAKRTATRRWFFPAGPAVRRTLASGLFSLGLLSSTPVPGDVSPARIVVPDVLCLPEEEVFVKAFLYRGSAVGLFKPEIPGEALLFADAGGKTLDQRLTDPAGMARIRFRSPGTGKAIITVSLQQNPRYRADPAAARIFVRNRRLPLYFVLIEGALMTRKPLSFLWEDPGKTDPANGGVEKTREIAGASTLVYLSILPTSYLRKMRDWLDHKEAAPAPLLALGASDLDLLKAEIEPGLEFIDALRRDRDHPACLVTGNPAMAAAAGKKGLQVFLLRHRKGQVSSFQSKAEVGEGTTVVEGWDEVPSECRGPRTAGKAASGRAAAKPSGGRETRGDR